MQINLWAIIQFKKAYIISMEGLEQLVGSTGQLFKLNVKLKIFFLVVITSHPRIPFKMPIQLTYFPLECILGFDPRTASLLVRPQEGPEEAEESLISKSPEELPDASSSSRSWRQCILTVIQAYSVNSRYSGEDADGSVVANPSPASTTSQRHNCN